jgi:hypothetical protein
MKTTILGLMALAVSTAAVAHGEHSTKHFVKVYYDTPAHNRGIYSYPLIVPSVLISNHNIIYVDKAHGQAIYSYPRNTK